MSETNSNSCGEWISSELVAEDPDLIDLVEEFVGTLGTRISDLQNALEQNDLDTLKSLAHQLKGAGGGHGYPILTEKSAVLEQQAIAGEVDKIRPGVEELAQIVSRIVVTPKT